MATKEKNDLFRDRLMSLIDETGITQKQLSKKSGISESTISRYLSCERTPQIIENLPNLALALHTSTDYLLGATNIVSPKTNLSDDEEILLHCFHQLDCYERNILWSVLDKHLSEYERNVLKKQETTSTIA